MSRRKHRWAAVVVGALLMASDMLLPAPVSGGDARDHDDGLKVTVDSALSDDDLGLSADWGAWPCCTLQSGGGGSYTSIAGSNAVDGIAIRELQVGVTNYIDLLDPDVHVSRTGTTGIRLHVARGVPVARNQVVSGRGRRSSFAIAAAAASGSPACPGAQY